MAMISFARGSIPAPASASKKITPIASATPLAAAESSSRWASVESPAATSRAWRPRTAPHRTVRVASGLPRAARKPCLAQSTCAAEPDRNFPASTTSRGLRLAAPTQSTLAAPCCRHSTMSVVWRAHVLSGRNALKRSRRSVARRASPLATARFARWNSGGADPGSSRDARRNATSASESRWYARGSKWKYTSPSAIQVALRVESEARDCRKAPMAESASPLKYAPSP